MHRGHLRTGPASSTQPHRTAGPLQRSRTSSGSSVTLLVVARSNRGVLTATSSVSLCTVHARFLFVCCVTSEVAVAVAWFANEHLPLKDCVVLEFARIECALLTEQQS